MERFKHPRTPHLPWSLGASDDDIRLNVADQFIGKDIIITEKLDGENITVYSDGYVHARSRDSASHPSQDYIKGWAAGRYSMIPSGCRITFEYLYAIHSITYTKLPSYLFLINMVDEHNICLSWHDLVKFANYIEIPTVPFIAEMECGDNWERVLSGNSVNFKSKYGSVMEGYVIRNADMFLYEQYAENCAKYVRENHVTTDEHWTKNWKQASLYRGEE